MNVAGATTNPENTRWVEILSQNSNGEQKCNRSKKNNYVINSKMKKRTLRKIMLVKFHPWWKKRRQKREKHQHGKRPFFNKTIFQSKTGRSSNLSHQKKVEWFYSHRVIKRRQKHPTHFVPCLKKRWWDATTSEKSFLWNLAK